MRENSFVILFSPRLSFHFWIHSSLCWAQLASPPWGIHKLQKQYSIWACMSVSTKCLRLELILTPHIYFRMKHYRIDILASYTFSSMYVSPLDDFGAMDAWGRYSTLMFQHEDTVDTLKQRSYGTWTFRRHRDILAF